jgi:hypothetical protein
MKIAISDHCMNMIRAAAQSPFFDDSEAVRTREGWIVQVSEEVAERLSLIREPGEPMGAAVERAVAALQAKH